MRKHGAIITAVILSTVTLLAASYEDALDKFIKKDYKGSLEILADNLNIDNDLTPNSPNFNIRYLAAHNHWELGNRESAIIHFKRCIDIKREEPTTYMDLSLFLLSHNRLRDAEIYARQGLKLQEHELFYYILGKTSMVRKNYYRAKEYLERAVAINPEISFMYNDLGICFMGLKSYSKANTAFTIAQSLNDKDPAIINNLAISFEAIGKKDEAQKYYLEAQSLSPNSTIIAGNLKRVQ